MAVLGMEDADGLLRRGLIRQDQYDRNAATVDPAPVPTMPPGLMDQANFAPAPAPVVPVTDVAPPVMPPAPVMPTGFDLQAQAIAAGAAAAQQQAAADQPAIDFVQKEQARIAQDRAAIENEKLKAAEAVQAKHAKSVQELADTKIDADSYWEKKSTGGKIGVGIAMLLGAFGSGSENKAATIIRQAIDQDIEVQKANYQAKKGAAQEQESLYGKMMGVYKDEKAATAAAQAEAYNIGAMKIQAQAAKYKGAAASAAALGAIGQLKAAQDAAMMQAQAAGDDPETAGLTADQRERWIPKSNVQGLPYGLAKYGGKEDVKQTRVALVEAADAMEGIQELKKMTGDWFGSLNQEKRAAAQSMQTALIGKLRTAVFGPGVLTEGEQERARELLPDPSAVFSLDAKTLARLNTLETMLKSSASRKGAAIGLKTSADDAKSINFTPKKK